MSLKDKLFDSLGAFGIILYYILSSLIFVLPMVMIDTSFFLDLLFFGIMQLFPPTCIIFWIWGLICAITGPQDWLAIVYYIVFGVGCIPFFISTLRSMFSRN